MSADMKHPDQTFLETIQTVVTNSRQWQQIFESTELIGSHKLRLLRYDGLTFYVRAWNEADKHVNIVDIANGTFIFPFKRGNAHSALKALEKACNSGNKFIRFTGKTNQVAHEAMLTMIFHFLTRLLQSSSKVKVLPVNFEPELELFSSPSLN